MTDKSYPLPSASYASDALSSGGVYTTSNGRSVDHPYSVLRVGTDAHPDGPLLLQDFHLLDALSHFDRERIPERVVHAKGGGAHGTFTCTHPIPELCAAKLFGEQGKKTPVTVRFSTVGGESGSSDAARDPRGFSIKFRTEEGNMDWVFNNTPVFFLRDPAKFAPFIHTQKRHPSSHLTHADDGTHFWDWLGQNPEAAHQFVYLFGPRGIPRSWQQMQGYSGHTFKFVAASGAWRYCQIHVLSNQGTSNFSAEEAAQASPDVHQKALYDDIEAGKFPSWAVKYQIATPEELQKARVNPFDLTQVWPRKLFPLHELGQLELNRNVQNYFAEIEQVAFNPSHLVPGMEPSADPVLQSRLFSYPDTHRHRVGPNYQQLPVNAPLRNANGGEHIYNFQRDGGMALLNQGARPLHLSSLDPPVLSAAQYDLYRVAGHQDGHAISYLSGVSADDFVQPRKLYNEVFSEQDRKSLQDEVAGHMASVRDKGVLARALAVFHQVEPSLAAALAPRVGVEAYEKDLKKMRFMGSHNLEAGLSAQQMIKELHPDRFRGEAPGINAQTSLGRPGKESNGHANGHVNGNGTTNGTTNGHGEGLLGKVKTALAA